MATDGVIKLTVDDLATGALDAFASKMKSFEQTAAQTARATETAITNAQALQTTLAAAKASGAGITTAQAREMREVSRERALDLKAEAQAYKVAQDAAKAANTEKQAAAQAEKTAARDKQRAQEQASRAAAQAAKEQSRAALQAEREQTAAAKRAEKEQSRAAKQAAKDQEEAARRQEKAMRDVKTAATTLASTVGAACNKAGNFMLGLAGTAVGLGSQAERALSAIDDAAFTLERANKLGFARAQDAAAAATNANMAVGDFVDNLNQMQNFTKEFMNPQQQRALVTMMGQMARISGTSVADSDRATRQLMQSLANRKFEKDELKIIAEANPMLADALAKAAGTTMDRFMADSDLRGSLSSVDLVMKMLATDAATVSQEYSKLPQSLALELNNVKAEIMQTVADLAPEVLPLVRDAAAAVKSDLLPAFKQSLPAMKGVAQFITSTILPNLDSIIKWGIALKGVGLAVELGKGVKAAIDFGKSLSTVIQAGQGAAAAAGAAGSALGGGAGLAGTLATLGPYALAAAAALAGVAIVCKQIASMRAAYADSLTNNDAAGAGYMKDSKAAADAAAKAATRAVLPALNSQFTPTLTVPDSMKPGGGADPKLYTDYQAALKDLTAQTAAGAAAMKKAGASDAELARYQDARDAEKKALEAYHNSVAAVAEREKRLALAKSDVAADATQGFAADLQDFTSRIATGKTELERLKDAETALATARKEQTAAERALTYARDSSNYAGQTADQYKSVPINDDATKELKGLRTDVQKLQQPLQWIVELEHEVAKNSQVSKFMEAQTEVFAAGPFQQALQQMLDLKGEYTVGGLIG